MKRINIVYDKNIITVNFLRFSKSTAIKILAKMQFESNFTE